MDNFYTGRCSRAELRMACSQKEKWHAETVRRKGKRIQGFGLPKKF
jgi:hypothetical protein